MGETTNKIETYIESKREDLGSNLQELEQRVKSATDWRQQFRNNPMTMLGVALGGGVLLGTVLGGRKRRQYTGSSFSEPHSVAMPDTRPNTRMERQKNKAVETLDSIKGALIGVAATRLKDFIGEVVPGFHDHLRRTEEPQSRSSNVH